MLLPSGVSTSVPGPYAEAGANEGFPLDDRSALEIFIAPRPQLSAPRARYVYFPEHAEVPEAQAVVVRGRSFVIGALVDIPGPGAQGVLFSQGSRFGGHSLYVKDGRLHYAGRAYQRFGCPVWLPGVLATWKRKFSFDTKPRRSTSAASPIVLPCALRLTAP